MSKYWNMGMVYYNLSIYMCQVAFDSFRPSDATQPHWTWWTLVQKLACCRTATSHYLKRSNVIIVEFMMTSSNGNIFRVTGHCGEFTGPGEIPTQRPVTRGFHVFLDLCLNKPLSKQSRGWWFATLSRPLWRHCNGLYDIRLHGISLKKYVEKRAFKYDIQNVYDTQNLLAH